MFDCMLLMSPYAEMLQTPIAGKKSLQKLFSWTFFCAKAKMMMMMFVMYVL